MYSVSLTSSENWIGAGNGLLTVTNTTTKPISGWTFTVSLKDTVISTCWDVDFTVSKTSYTFKGKDWNKDLAPMQTITSGFAYTGPASFTASTKDVNVKLAKSAVVPVVPKPTPVVPKPTPVVPKPQPSSTTPIAPVPLPVSTSPLKKNVVSYIAQWDLYGRNYPILSIPGDKLTHIMYAFCLPNPSQADFDILKAHYSFPPKPYYPNLPEGSLAIHDEYAFGVQVADFAKLKQKYPHLKVCLSVGGWTLSWTMSKVMADQVLRKRFVTTIADSLLTNGFDGIDLDWEFPGKQGAGYNVVDEVNDSKNLVLFLKEMRVEMDKRSPTKHLELSCAAGINPVVLEQYKDCGGLLDQFNLMTYDFYGSWENFGGGHHSQMYHNPLHIKGNPEFCCDAAVKHALKYFKPQQIGLGVPFYARGWAKMAKDPANPTAPIIFGNNSAGPGVTLSENTGGEPGLTCWKDLSKAIKSKEYTEYFDEVSRVPYCVNQAGQVWTYDNAKSISEKVKYVCDNNLGAIMIWQQSDDVRDGVDSLLDAVVSALKTYAK